LTSQKPLINS